MLIVDDDARLCSQLARHFRAVGWVAEEAGRGAGYRFVLSPQAW
ncbi:response regulator [Haliea sp.]